MPVVIGQANVARCRAASAPRRSLIVTSLPFGTCFINESTSNGAGITMVPSPQRRLIRPETRPTRGRPLLSASFSRQVFLGFMGTSLRLAVDLWVGLEMGHNLDLNVRPLG